MSSVNASKYAAMIINSVKKFAKENVDVSLFGKILRNDLEEDYRIIYFKLKSTLFARFSKVKRKNVETS